MSEQCGECFRADAKAEGRLFQRVPVFNLVSHRSDVPIAEVGLRGPKRVSTRRKRNPGYGVRWDARGNASDG